jgi:hypothetical protein
MTILRTKRSFISFILLQYFPGILGAVSVIQTQKIFEAKLSSETAGWQRACVLYHGSITDNFIRESLPRFRRVRKIVKSDYWPRHVCPSVHSHEKTRLPQDRFS